MQLTSTPTPHSLFPAAEKSALGWGRGGEQWREEGNGLGEAWPTVLWLPLRKTMASTPQLLLQGGPVSRVGCCCRPIPAWALTAEL